MLLNGEVVAREPPAWLEDDIVAPAPDKVFDVTDTEDAYDSPPELLLSIAPTAFRELAAVDME